MRSKHCIQSSPDTRIGQVRPYWAKGTLGQIPTVLELLVDNDR